LAASGISLWRAIARPFGQSLGREIRRLAAFGNRFDDLRRKERHPDQSPRVAALDQS